MGKIDGGEVGRGGEEWKEGMLANVWGGGRENGVGEGRGTRERACMRALFS